MADTKQRVAFIGTGIMGAPIAGHILDAGYPLTVYNRTKAKADGLVERGAVWAPSVADAAREADVIFTMVGFPEDVEEIYLAGDGLLSSSKPGAVLIDLTTSSPSLARDIAGAAQVEGRMAFDCPVTGGESGAIAGTLTAIAGATEHDIEPVRALLETFSSRICCFGGAGKGQAAKLANQVALAASMVGMADALSLAQQEGLDLEQTREMIMAGTGASGAMDTLAPKALVGDWKPGFMVQHFIKDLGLALQEAEEREIALPGADTAFALYDMLDAIGGGRLGTQAITLLYQEESEAVAAGLDWSLYTSQHEHDDECGCGHDHGDDGCGCGHHHDHGDDHECCHGHGHEDGDHECCHGHHGEGHAHGEGCCHHHGE
ncbi:NAD(P)-dependent oxidoreductase [Collinsella sp. An2]|uniref:NAD(P)-dependent oxidoreductase n=1 Tax=Collinsella sp. An2 TaxID=1965585 RepID=UPI000B3A396D|nr:NAD(P)-dependent oxidoreductase [Collinsella sp. An2]OUP09499.1 3-hydroxyisobutyrate dehydrogenase [Collinsella sp. An2]